MEIIKNLNINWQTTVIVILVLVGAVVLTRVLRWLIDKSFVTASEKLRVDSTRYKFFKNAVSLIIWFLAFATLTLLIPQLKALAITLFAGAGLMVVIIGLAAQQAFANIVSGVFMVLFQPFRVGDMIKVGAFEYGIVEDITLRHTVITSFENKRIIIPNSVVSAETITNDNIEDSKICRWIEVGISYDSDVDLATKILQEEAMKHPNCIDVRTEEDIKENLPQVRVRLTSFGDFSVNLRADVWTNDPYRARHMHSDINRAFKKRFDKEGIEIPFPYRTVVYKNDLPPNAKAKENEQD